jgi:hypothetical protein
MKKSDWALIILIVAVVGVISWFVIGSILPEVADEKVKTAPEISANVNTPANNVMLYDADRPSWCPLVADDSATDESTNEESNENSEANRSPSASENVSTGGEGKQPINSAFNSCAINSSFTTTTE